MVFLSKVTDASTEDGFELFFKIFRAPEHAIPAVREALMTSGAQMTFTSAVAELAIGFLPPSSPVNTCCALNSLTYRILGFIQAQHFKRLVSRSP